MRTYTAMPSEKAQVATTTRPKVPMRRLGADCLVVVMKRGNARGAKGAGHRHWRGSTGNGRNPLTNARRQPSCDGTSRMNREVHVRICERLGVKLPGPTRQFRSHGSVRGAVRNGRPYREHQNQVAENKGLFWCENPVHNGGHAGAAKTPCLARRRSSLDCAGLHPARTAAAGGG